MKISVLDSFAKKYSFLSTKSGCLNRCIDASILFLDHIGIRKDVWHLYMRSNCDDVNVNELNEHHWVCVDGLNVDWTARQFDETASFPKIWVENNTNDRKRK